jgi:integrase
MVESGQFRVRARITDPRTGHTKEVDQLIQAATAQAAAAIRATLIQQAGSDTLVDGRRTRVGDFARLWIESKAASIDPGTHRLYADNLEDHVLPTLGDFLFDELRTIDVQRWINDSLARTHGKAQRRYAVSTVHGWFRSFRTMTRDAVAQLDLPRDPTARVTFPVADERDEANALLPEELSRFLAEMGARYPNNYALASTLAFTGLRFCHASALRWEDVDEKAGVIRIVRKNSKGSVGPVSRRKRAPRELPLVPELAEILRTHRRAMLEAQSPGFDSGWCFPSEAGTLRTPSSLHKAWSGCLKAIGFERRFTVHGLRRTFNDLARRAGVDGIVTKSITGHVTERMREHYSTVQLDEKREAVANVIRLLPVGKVGTEVGTGPGKRKAG